jgi:hypothetical protein
MGALGVLTLPPERRERPADETAVLDLEHVAEALGIRLHAHTTGMSSETREECSSTWTSRVNDVTARKFPGVPRTEGDGCLFRRL